MSLNDRSEQVLQGYGLPPHIACGARQRHLLGTAIETAAKLEIFAAVRNLQRQRLAAPAYRLTAVLR